MKYKILLLDIDDTLLDFGANEADSLSKLFRRHGYAFTEELFRVYNSVNKKLWSDYEKGHIPMDHIMSTRFAETLRRLGKDEDGAAWEKEYRELLGSGCQLMDGALELCQRLSVSHRLFVVTNGMEETQVSRLKQSGLYEFFEGFFYSQSVGFQKPSMEFFDYVMGHIKDFNKEETLMIGDSLTTDIKGGRMAGIDTCWINTKAQEAPADMQSTYTITCLEELYDIIN